VAADRTVSAFGSGCVGDRYRFLAICSFGTHQMELGTGMHIMATQAGNCVLFPGMQIMKIAGPVAETVLHGLFLRYQRQVVTLETKLLHRKAELELEIGRMGSMAAKAVVFHDRRMHAFLGGLVIVTFITDLGALVLDRIQAVIALMVASGGVVAGSALLIGQPAVNKGGGYFAGVALVAGFSAYRINSSFGFSG